MWCRCLYALVAMLAIAMRLSCVCVMKYGDVALCAVRCCAVLCCAALGYAVVFDLRCVCMFIFCVAPRGLSLYSHFHNSIGFARDMHQGLVD